MPLKVCTNGHLTGTKECGRCESRTSTVRGPSGRRAVSKKRKRAITQALRNAGAVPVKDL
jgi:hypothetical protein